MTDKNHFSVVKTQFSDDFFQLRGTDDLHEIIDSDGICRAFANQENAEYIAFLMNEAEEKTEGEKND